MYDGLLKEKFPLAIFLFLIVIHKYAHELAIKRTFSTEPFLSETFKKKPNFLVL